MNRSNNANANKARRRFLQGTALAGGAAVLAAASGETLTPQNKTGGTRDAGPADDGKSRGYRVTPHIEAYYRSTQD